MHRHTKIERRAQQPRDQRVAEIERGAAPQRIRCQP